MVGGGGGRGGGVRNRDFVKHCAFSTGFVMLCLGISLVNKTFGTCIFVFYRELV